MQTVRVDHIGADLDGFERFDYSCGSYASSFYICPQEYGMNSLHQFGRNHYRFSYRPITESDASIDSRVAEILSCQYRDKLPIKDSYIINI